MHIDTFAIGILLLSSIFYANGDVTGPLKVLIKSASDLPDTDGWFNLPDPYVGVYAYRSDGTSLKKSTDDISGNLDPVFNEELVFGPGTWSYFLMKVFDVDVHEDDIMIDEIRVDIVAGDAGKTQSTATSGPRVKYIYYI